MDVIVKEQKKQVMEIELPGQNETLLHLLTERLQEDERVETASYFIGHPQLDNPILKLKTKNATPKVVLKSVADGIAKDFAELNKLSQEL